MREQRYVIDEHHPRTTEASGILPDLDEVYFTTGQNKILEHCRCIVPEVHDEIYSPHSVSSCTTSHFTDRDRGNNSQNKLT